VHPTLPYVLTSSDDMLIKLWDWDKGWACCQVFEGHSHYVMQVRPKSNIRKSLCNIYHCVGTEPCMPIHATKL
jgi:WD40 repeat protein